ncbi:hypothetical protein RhiirA5_419299 [Rhizophagus irregularis]|uniref:Uncharacterized protein n=3 Tax=Rhizophagus irregularis TaxID=588596 RepID=U9UUK2_RHIID|nr:hypothetical protein GLOIN_2v1473503 [Rhizophagus irregularis DAOM 181602=DAOM 197198]ANQ32395.1 MATA-HMG [Rhizophagus irregularis]EXX64084.1 hypothetical protein RirG_146120 [Rhizophagus irregularis DAOM 197198w]ANQ32397.1 MATA-HMG [Rhizophagus irregularis]ANQ32398.1 MATA-HMG [Rhizophagus irregularis]PKC06635.1 hypothetical protein RhiirA5_419299 [Rhizophagus irregularis]|eukprot:XP_025184815.1 hypothetical protein GLOIN_2v1473503 [Rhizophagus irregularis DAOM 181602=DAOM 197198]
MNTNEIPLINVPYPPELTVEDILSRRSEEKLRLRAPNQFFIYRLAYIRELKKIIGESISMTRISPQISSSWSREPPEVKQAYKNLSGLTENRLKEMRKNDTPIFIHENFSSPPPPPSQPDENIIIYDVPFYPYSDYFCDDYFYDYYNNCYYSC